MNIHTQNKKKNKKKMAQCSDKVAVMCLTLLTLIATTMSRRVVTRMIHRDSFDSPYYNPDASIAELGERDRERSRSRFAHLAASGGSHRAGVNANMGGTMFMAKISIGDPPYPQLLLIDTGSSLTWLQCHPCIKCFPQSIYLYDPSKSESYEPLSCNTPECPFRSRCNGRTTLCKFDLLYADGSTASGLVATETLTFSPSDSVPDVFFGCAYNNSVTFSQAAGILGLGPAALSLATHLGSRFSYCIGSIRDPSYSPNFLVLGDESNLVGDTTNLEADILYYLTMTGISIDTKAIDIDPSTFKRCLSGKGGVVIDSGSTLTYLAAGAYGPLNKEVMGLLDGTLERVEDQDRLCYKGLIEKDLIGFPVVTFHFEGGAELGLDTFSLFKQYSNQHFCMAIETSPFDPMSLIGVVAQQGYNVGYDLIDKKLSLQRTDCNVYEKFITSDSKAR